VHKRLIATHANRPANGRASDQASIELVHVRGHDRTLMASPDGPSESGSAGWGTFHDLADAEPSQKHSSWYLLRSRGQQRHPLRARPARGRSIRRGAHPGRFQRLRQRRALARRVFAVVRRRFFQHGAATAELRRRLPRLAYARGPAFDVTAFDHILASLAETIDELPAIPVDLSLENAPSIRYADLFVSQLPEDGSELGVRERLRVRDGFHALDCCSRRGLCQLPRWGLRSTEERHQARFRKTSTRAANQKRRHHGRLGDIPED
jgi:hypothetical protein